MITEKTFIPTNSCNAPCPSKEYNRLIKSLPELELDVLNHEMNELNEDDIKNLVGRINIGDLLCWDHSTTRKIIVTALGALKMGDISVEQMASIHIMDGAMRDLVTHSTTFQHYEYVKNGKNKHKGVTVETKIKDSPSAKPQGYYFDTIISPEGVSVNQLPERMQQPTLKRFFALSDDEWNHFCKIMQSKPLSEKKFYTIVVPKFGYWSGIVAQVQSLVKLCHPVDLRIEHNRGFSVIKHMIIPSFTILQAVLDVKANTVGRSEIKLIPTYYLLKPKDYADTKKNVGIPVALYFPEAFDHLRYNRDNSKFKAKIDGWEDEGPFASIIHDYYHALRELVMTENIAKARYHLASIAKDSEFNNTDLSSHKVSEKLIDGELIFSIPKDSDTIFNQTLLEDYGISHSQIFGEIFYCTSIKRILHPELKKAFIEDMVRNEVIWEETFNLGREDLLPQDQEIYDALDLEINGRKRKKIRI